MSTATPCSLHPMETQPCAICTTGIRAAPAPDFASTDPIDDLCARLLNKSPASIGYFIGLCREAAAALQRLRAENAAINTRFVNKRVEWRAAVERAERAEAERDTLAAIVRAADAMRHVGANRYAWADAKVAYDAARAKVTL